MKTRWLYYIASGLLAFFAIAHHLGFRQVDPTWHANDVVASMQLTTVRWAFALCFVVITVLMWTNFFAAPLVFAILVTLCLLLAARQPRTSP